MSLSLLEEIRNIRIKQDNIINNQNQIIDHNKMLLKEIYLNKQKTDEKI
jgi:hypothetical protein